MAYVGYGTGASTSIDRGPGTPVDPSKGGDPGQNYYYEHDYPQNAAGGLVNQFPQSNALMQGIYNGWYNTQYLPNQWFQQAQLDQLGNQQGLAYAQGDLSSQIANQNAGFAMRDIGLSREGLGVQQQAVADDTAKQMYQAKSAGVAADNLMGPYAGQQRAWINQQKDQADKMLGIQAKRLGLNEDETRARLQNALDQIGISTNVSVDQLLGEMYKVQQGGLSVFSPLFGALAQAQGVTIPST